MANNDRYLVSSHERVTSQKMEDDRGMEEDHYRTPVANRTNDKGNNVIHLFENQTGLPEQVSGPSSKNLDKTVPIKSGNANLETLSDKAAVREDASAHRSKKRRTDPTTGELDNNKIASGTPVTPVTPVKQDIDEIDIPDINNQLAVVEYIQDLYTFYRGQQHVCRPSDYMEKQIYLNENARAVAIGWVIQVHRKCELWPETLYLAVHIIDRYLSLEVIPKSILQLVVMCGLLIASKYEENIYLGIDELGEITNNKYSKEIIICMEKLILNRLDWYLTVPTVYMFLVRFVKAAKADKELEHMIYYFGELGLVEYKMTQYLPCMGAAAAVYAARCSLGKYPLWTDTLERHTTYSESDLQECATILTNAHLVARRSKHKLRVVYTKYQLQQYEGPAHQPPIMTPIEKPKPAVPVSY